jgi:CRISPR system Cascade subunit CasC
VDKFLQIHLLTSYPPSLLNRDDSGLAKQVHWGNSERLRISSQCLKRHWRQALEPTFEVPAQGFRTRHFLSLKIRTAILDAEWFQGDEDYLDRTLMALNKAYFKDQVKDLDTPQAVYYSNAEAAAFVDLYRQLYIEERSVLDGAASVKEKASGEGTPKTSKKGDPLLAIIQKRRGESQLQLHGINNAMFGRFVTSDLLDNMDASIYVSHALGVSAAEIALDFFTAVEDLANDEPGSAMMGDTELGSAAFYIYAVIDLLSLSKNLTRVPTAAKVGDIASEFVRVAATVSPGAKLGSTAPFAYASTVLLELGDEQPRTLANAFLNAIEPAPRSNVLDTATKAMLEHRERIGAMYGSTSRWSALSTQTDGLDFSNVPLRHALTDMVAELED